MKTRIINLLRYLLGVQGYLAIFMVAFIRALKLGRWRYKVVNCNWMDRYSSPYEGVLRDAYDGYAYSPWFVDKKKPNPINTNLPELKYRHFKKAKVSVVSSSVLLADESLAIERVGRYEQHGFDYSAGHILMHNGNYAIVQDETSFRLNRGIFLGGNGCFNYYHWLIEIIPRIEFFYKLPEQYITFPVLVSCDVNDIPSFSEILHKFCASKEVIFLDKNKTYIVDDLIYVDTPNNLPFNLIEGEQLKVNYTLMHPGSVEYIRRVCLSEDVTANGVFKYPKKIFLKRKMVRRKYNQEEVESCLKKYGFVSIYMEELEFDEQIRTMYHADLIVGPTGAAWANLVHCSEKSKALCWMAEEFSEFSAFSTLAEIIGVDLKYLTYACGSKSSAEVFVRNYIIDSRKIEEWYLSLEK